MQINALLFHETAQLIADFGGVVFIPAVGFNLFYNGFQLRLQSILCLFVFFGVFAVFAGGAWSASSASINGLFHLR